MNKMRQADSKLMMVLFWAFIATILVFQLLAVDEYNLPKAVVYSTAVTGTFAIYVHLVLRHIVKKHMKKKRLSVFISWVMFASILAAVLLTMEDYALDSCFARDWERYKEAMLPRFFGMLMAAILISGIAYAFELYRHHIETLKATQTLKDRLNELELKSIRQQLSPHFTFNVLNNLQFLIQKDKGEALNLLAQYSKILRYYVYESQQKSILLNDEIAFLRTYLELEQDRLKDEADIGVTIDIAPNDLKIAPFVLSTFVENSFKHLSMHGKRVSVLIRCKDNDLYMQIHNTYDKKSSSSQIHQGIGLEQVKKRLELIYTGKHSLTFDSKENIFQVELNIKFD